MVFDRDSFPEENFDNAINKANSIGYEVAWSNEAFELWYLLHFKEQSSAMNRDEYKGKLSKYLNRTYTKNDKNLYNDIKKYQRIATDRAKKLVEEMQEIAPHKANPCTHVYKLVNRLINLYDIENT